MMCLLAINAHAAWVEFGSHYYTLTSDATNWEEAENNAGEAGGHLVAINSSIEQAFLNDTFLIGDFATLPLWIGLTDKSSEGTFIWSTGEEVTFTNWTEGEPNNVDFFGDRVGEDYVAMNWAVAAYGIDDEETGEWNDTPLNGTPFLPDYFMNSSTGPYFGIIERDMSPVPLPASLWLLGSALSVLFSIKHKS